MTDRTAAFGASPPPGACTPAHRVPAARRARLLAQLHGATRGSSGIQTADVRSAPGSPSRAGRRAIISSRVRPRRSPRDRAASVRRRDQPCPARGAPWSTPARRGSAMHEGSAMSWEQRPERPSMPWYTRTVGAAQSANGQRVAWRGRAGRPGQRRWPGRARPADVARPPSRLTRVSMASTVGTPVEPAAGVAATGTARTRASRSRPVRCRRRPQRRRRQAASATARSAPAFAY